MGFFQSSGIQMLLSSLMGGVCAVHLCAHMGLFLFLLYFNAFRTPRMTGRNEAKNLTLNSRKGSLLPLDFVQKSLFSNTSGADVCHLWNACFWNYQSTQGATSRNWGFHPVWAGCEHMSSSEKSAKFSIPECQWIPFSVKLKTPNYCSVWEARNLWFLVMMVIFVK